MLRAVSKNVNDCYERARCAERLAAMARTANERRLYLDDEKSWLALATSYDHQERLEAFLKELRSLLGQRIPH
jgi:methionyl-tRNA synthetase